MNELLLLAEVAAATTPVIGTWGYARQGRKRLRQALRTPLFWDGGQAVSLATIYAELNGEGDVELELREIVGGSGPLGLPELERGVTLMQANPSLARKLVLEAATAMLLRGQLPRRDAPSGPAGLESSVAMLDRLAARQEELGFFAFVGSLNAERAPQEPALLPVDALMPGGLPVGPPEDGDPPLTDLSGAGVLGMLAAIGLGRDGDWLPGVIRAVGDLARERQVKKARDAYHRTLGQLGKAVAESLRRRAPAGDVVRRNTYVPLDAYTNLATRAGARRPKTRHLRQMLVPSVAQALDDELMHAIARATALVTDKCVSLERLLAGKHGHAVAGEVIWRHRTSLLAGVDPGAFPLAAVEAAHGEYRRAREDTQPGPGGMPGAGGPGTGDDHVW